MMMIDRYLGRLLMHVAAVLAAAGMWWICSEFAMALAASLGAFLVVNAAGHIAFGPMPTGHDLRREVLELIRERD